MMRLYTHDDRRQRQARSAQAGDDLPPLKPGTSWVRFGHETLLYNDDDEVEAPAEPRVSSRGARHPRRDVPSGREQLHVVVQHGRQFQQRHPDVPVLHDRGRFLLVQLDPSEAARLRDAADTCYGVIPVTEDMVVFEERGRVSARAADPAIRTLIDGVARPPLEATISLLTSFDTRHSTRAEYRTAATRLRDQLTEMGYATRVQSVPVGAGSSLNVIADKEGAGSSPRRVVIATAHLDSVNHDGGSEARAPGADDNGSGCAGLIDMARAFQPDRYANDLRFILFGGEEQGLFGSRRYVQSLSAAERARILAVVNMDMVGSSNTAARTVLLEGAAVSQRVIDALSEAASTYTQLEIETSLHPFNSDHVPFIDAGIPAVLTIEGADQTNDRVHSARDTAERLDYDLLMEIVRMNIAFVSQALGRVG
jgi:hypothetical protein